MKKLKLLDLFSGAGGAAMGYYRAGFTDILGIDCKPQPRYPFDFVQGDVFTLFGGRAGWGPPSPPPDSEPMKLSDFDLVHASPPCQRFSCARTIHPTIEHPDLVTPCREMLHAAKVPFVIENVVGAPIRCSIMLCGTMFGLRLLRHRHFEIYPEFLILTPPCKHEGSVKSGDYFCVVGGGGGNDEVPYARKTDCVVAMGIDWMTRKEMTQAVPPAYTEFIGREILK